MIIFLTSGCCWYQHKFKSTSKTFGWILICLEKFHWPETLAQSSWSALLKMTSVIFDQFFGWKCNHGYIIWYSNNMKKKKKMIKNFILLKKHLGGRVLVNWIYAWIYATWCSFSITFPGLLTAVSRNNADLRKMISLFSLLCVVACACPSSNTTVLKGVKNSAHHFPMWHVLFHFLCIYFFEIDTASWEIKVTKEYLEYLT